MPIIKHIVSFGSGELSPMLDGRTDIEKYGSGCKLLQNFIPTPQGALLKRPGLQRLGYVKQEDTDDETSHGQLVEFQITTHSSVILALGGRRMKFVDKGRMLKASTTPNAPDLTIVIPWADVDLRLLRWKQVNDVMWFVHPLYAPQLLRRYKEGGVWKWGLDKIDLGVDVPLLDENPKRARKITTSFKADDGAEAWAAGGTVYPAYAVNFSGYYRASGAGAAYDALVDEVYLCVTAHTMDTSYTGSNFHDHIYLNYNSAAPAGDQWCRAWPWAHGHGGGGYTAGYLAHRGGVIYKCLLNYSDSPPGTDLTKAPGTGANWATYWVAVRTMPTTVPRIFSQPTSETGEYEAGDRVSHAGKTWVCRADHTATTAKAPGGTAVYGDADDGVDKKLWVPSYSDTASEVGQRMTLTANANIFREGHVGSTWEIAARRAFTKYEVTLVASEEMEDKESDLLVVQGGWSFTTFGTWRGRFIIEISTDKGETWDRERLFISKVDAPRNASTEGYEEKRVLMRIRYEGHQETDEDDTNKPYAMLSTTEGRIRGLVRITEFVNEKQVKGRCVSPVEKTTTGLWSEGAWSDWQGFPRCVEMHQNRLLMAGTERRPHTIWGSAVDDYLNFNRGTEADRAYVHTLAIGTRDPILWMHSDKRLVVGNGGGEFTLRGENEAAPITPDSGVCDRHSSFGTHAGGAGHIVSDTVSLFVQNGGRALREMAYSFQSDKYESGNLNLLADHLFKNAIQDVAIQRQPFQILWVVASGQLFSLTYERSQEVVAWARHPVGGEVMAVSTVRRYAEDLVYFLVRRKPEGAGLAKMAIERLTPGGLLDAKDDGSWMDSYTSVTPPVGAAAIATFLAAHPLAGKKVVGFYRREMIGPKKLDAGFFKGLKGALNIGLPYSAVVQPMTPEMGLANGSSRTRECRIHSIVPNVYRARGGKFGETAKGPLDGLGLGSSAVLEDGEVEKSFDGKHDKRGNFCVVSDEPYPFTLRSVAVKLNYHGDER